MKKASMFLLALVSMLLIPAPGQANQWTNLGGTLGSTSRGFLDWTRNPYDGRYCLFSGAPRWNGSDNAVLCWDALNNIWQVPFVNDNSSNFPATPLGGDSASWFWNPRTTEYVVLDIAQVPPEAYAFNLINRTWRPIGNADIANISARQRPAGSGTAYSPLHNVVVITHGGNYSVGNVTRVINFNTTPPTYSELAISQPSRRGEVQNMFLYISSLRKFMLFGGFSNDTSSHLNDLWLLDPTTWTWSQVQQVNPPPPRADAMMGYDSAQNLVYLHGGYLNSGVTENSIVWILDLNRTPYTWTALPVPAGTAGIDYPRRRIAGTSIFDPARGFCVVGGYLQGSTDWSEPLRTWCFRHTLADSTPPADPSSSGGQFVPLNLGDLTVNWLKSPSDTGSPSTTDVATYEVTRSEDSGVTWKDSRLVTATGASTYSYTYRQIPISQVRVRAIDAANNASHYVRLF